MLRFLGMGASLACFRRVEREEMLDTFYEDIMEKEGEVGGRPNEDGVFLQ